MWIIETEAQRKERERVQDEQLKRWAEEARTKAEAHEAWKKTHTCPHCGRTDPLPPWLY